MSSSTVDVTVEKSWMTKSGYRAEVIFITDKAYENIASDILQSSWRCGYVRVPKDHPLENLSYNDSHACLRDLITEETPVGKRSMIDVFLYAAKMPDLPPITIAIEAHGGITFAGERENKGGWWFGFDCHHSGDTIEKCTLEYCVNECEELARQLKELEKWTPTEVSE